MGTTRNGAKRGRVVKRAKRSLQRGVAPVFVVDIERRIVPELPDLLFDGARPEEVIEAARRSIAAEIGVRADEVEVTPLPSEPTS